MLDPSKGRNINVSAKAECTSLYMYDILYVNNHQHGPMTKLESE